MLDSGSRADGLAGLFHLFRRAIVVWAVLALIFSAVLSVPQAREFALGALSSTCYALLSVLGFDAVLRENVIRVYDLAVRIDAMCLAWVEAAAALAIPLASRIEPARRVLFAIVGVVVVVLLNVTRICVVCAVSYDPELALFIHDVVSPMVAGLAIAGWLLYFSRSCVPGRASTASAAVPALALVLLLGGCSSFAERDVAGWRRIQEACAAAESGGVSDSEIEQIVGLCLSDAWLCDSNGARFGRLQFAVAKTMFVRDLRVAQELWANVVPYATVMALNDEARAKSVLSCLSYLGPEGTDDATGRLDVLDPYMAAFEESDSEVVRNNARLQRAYARVALMEHVDPAERASRRQEVASLSAAAEQDGLREIGGDLSSWLRGFGTGAVHGFPEIDGKAWVPLSDDPAWWRQPADSFSSPWSVLFFTSADCGYCGPYWEELSRAVEACDPGCAPRVIAVVASDEVPKHLRLSGSWGVYRSRRAPVSWLAGWGVSGVPTAFILDRDGRFARVFLSRDDVVKAIGECAKSL